VGHHMRYMVPHINKGCGTMCNNREVPA
jgi:hypothetical protein